MAWRLSRGPSLCKVSGLMRNTWVLPLVLSLCACDNGGALPGLDDLAGADASSDGGGVLPNPEMDLAGLILPPDLSPPPPDLSKPPPDLTPPPVDPGMPGAFKIASFSLTAPVAQGVSLSLLVTGPSDDGKALSMKDAPYPTVILSPGFSIPAANYNSYAQRLASHGFVVVAQTYRSAGNHPQNRDDTVKLVSWLLAPSGPDAARLAGRVDPMRIGATGHSLGGKVTFLAAAADPRIVAALGIDPVNSNPPIGGVGADAITPLGAYRGATGFLGETTNSMGIAACAPAADNYQKFYAKAPSPSFATTFVAANHNDFVDQQGCAVCGICFGGNASKPRTLSLAVKYVTAFFRRHLLGDQAMDSWLTGPQLQADVMAGAVTQVTK